MRAMPTLLLAALALLGWGLERWLVPWSAP